MNSGDNDPALSDTFQIVIVKKATGSDVAGWDFDIEYNFGISKLIIKVMGEYDLIFEMKNLKTQVFVENGKDIAIDLSI